MSKPLTAYWMTTGRRFGKTTEGLRQIINSSFEQEATELNIRVTSPNVEKVFSILLKMDCECGFETGSEESYKNSTCYRCMCLELLK